MTNNKSYSPFLYGLGASLIFALIMLAPVDKLLSEANFSDFQIEYIGLTVKMGILLSISLIGIKRLKLKSLAGLSSENKWSKKYLNLFPVYLFLIGIATFIGKDFSQINISNLLLLLTACLMVGFAEEFVFRGFLQSLFTKEYITKKKGVFLSVMWPALFFGGMHLVNLAKNDNIPEVIVQVIFATFIGFFFGALLLKTNKIIPLAITHGLINFFFLVSSLPGLIDDAEPEVKLSLAEQIAGSLPPLIIFAPLLIAGLLVLRKISQEEVLKKV